MLFDPSRFCYGLVTSTTYGTWLHGDPRGFVGAVQDEKGNYVTHNVYGTPYDADHVDLMERDRKHLKTSPVLLTSPQAEKILEQWHVTAEILHWHLFAVAVMSNHFHIALTAPVGTTKTILLRQLKTWATRTLNEHFGKARWWTDSGSVRFSFDEPTFENRINYVLRQEKSLIIWKNPEPFL